MYINFKMCILNFKIDLKPIFLSLYTPTFEEDYFDKKQILHIHSSSYLKQVMLNNVCRRRHGADVAFR
jgi:hypothetical protein